MRNMHLRTAKRGGAESHKRCWQLVTGSTGSEADAGVGGHGYWLRPPRSYSCSSPFWPSWPRRLTRSDRRTGGGLGRSFGRGQCAASVSTTSTNGEETADPWSP